jgi:uncharacterized membrane protein HdeD (DUF308 family)
MSDNLSPEITSLAKGVWWLVLIRGVFAIIFGIIALLAPAAALTGITVVIGIYLLLGGIIEIVHAVQTRSSDRRWDGCCSRESFRCWPGSRPSSSPLWPVSSAGPWCCG